MSYLPILLICLLGIALFIVAAVLPRRRRARQPQTIDTEPHPPRPS